MPDPTPPLSGDKLAEAEHIAKEARRLYRDTPGIPEDEKFWSAAHSLAVRNAVFAALTAREAPGWRDISTAPKCDIPVRLKGDGGPYGLVAWEATGWWGKLPNSSRKQWLCRGGYDQPASMRTAGYIPTHWQPIPSPPTAERGDG